MKKLLLIPALLAVLAALASAQDSMLLNFHSANANDPGAVSGGCRETSNPAHVVGGLSDTTWNNFNSVAGSRSLLYGNGAATAFGFSLTPAVESNPGGFGGIAFVRLRRLHV